MIMGDGVIRDFGPKEKVMASGGVQAQRSGGAKIAQKAEQKASAEKSKAEQSVTQNQKDQLKKQLKTPVSDLKVKEV